jgi:hypothetical protein
MEETAAEVETESARSLPTTGSDTPAPYIEPDVRSSFFVLQELIHLDIADIHAQSFPTSGDEDNSDDG